MKLIQNKGKKKKIFQVNDSGVVITSFTNKTLPSEENIAFENINGDRFFHIDKSPQYLVCAAVILIIASYILIDAIHANSENYLPAGVWATGGIAFILLYFLHRPKIFFLKTYAGRYIKFLVSKDSSEIQSFIADVLKKRNDYLKIKYGMPNPHLNYDSQFSNLNILQKERVISMEEYKEKIDELNRLFNQTAPKQIFYQYSKN
jgi:hypothetical protein